MAEAPRLSHKSIAPSIPAQAKPIAATPARAAKVPATFSRAAMADFHAMGGAKSGVTRLKPSNLPLSNSPSASGFQFACHAGNSRLVLDEGQIRVEAQMSAFREAVRYAVEVKAETGIAPAVSISFDHLGVFRNQFIRSGLTRKQKRYPKLSDLCDEIVDVFLPICDEYGIDVSEIKVIPEDSARSKITNELRESQLPEDVRYRLFVDQESPIQSAQKVTCTAITVEVFRSCVLDILRNSNGEQVQLDVFFEDDPWSKVTAYMRAVQFSNFLGLEANIRLVLCDENGVVGSGAYSHFDAAKSFYNLKV